VGGAKNERILQKKGKKRNRDLEGYKEDKRHTHRQIGCFFSG